MYFFLPKIKKILIIGKEKRIFLGIGKDKVGTQAPTTIGQGTSFPVSCLKKKRKQTIKY